MRACRSLSSFAFNLVLARMLGAGGTGMYFLAFSVAELATLVSRVGMDGTVVRLLAGGQGRSHAFYGRVMAFVVLVGLVMTAVVQVSAPFICADLFGEPELLLPLRIMALSIVPWSLVFIHGSLLQGAGRIGLSIFIHYVGLFLIGIPLLLVLAQDGSLAGAAIAQVGATVAVLVAGVALWRRTVADGFTLQRHDLPRGLWGSAVRASLSLLVINLLFAAGVYADTFLLGALATMNDVGTFRVAFRLAILGRAALDAVSAAIAPRMAAHHSSGNLNALERTARAGTALAALLTIPYWVIVLGFPREALGLFGSEFTVAATATILLVIGKMASTIAGPVATLLIMSGLERDLRNLTIVVTGLSILLLPVVIPVWGVLGVAAVSCLADILQSVAASVLVRRRLGIVVLPVPARVLPYRTDPAHGA